jgi:hypothetical protein
MTPLSARRLPKGRRAGGALAPRERRRQDRPMGAQLAAHGLDLACRWTTHRSSLREFAFVSLLASVAGVRLF